MRIPKHKCIYVYAGNTTGLAVSESARKAVKYFDAIQGTLASGEYYSGYNRNHKYHFGIKMQNDNFEMLALRSLERGLSYLCTESLAYHPDKIAYISDEFIADLKKYSYEELAECFKTVLDLYNMRDRFSFPEWFKFIMEGMDYVEPAKEPIKYGAADINFVDDVTIAA